MIYTRQFLQSANAKRLPKWIRDHKFFTLNNKVFKIWPKIGLPNDIKTGIQYQGKDYSLHFTSDGITGLWDLATMSMRGIFSCMHWKNPHHIHLMGSIVDPMLAMIYLSDGTKTEFGSSIVKRCLVRYIFGNGVSKPNQSSIQIERVYTTSTNRDPLRYDNKDPFHRDVSAIFENYLKEKINKSEISVRSVSAGPSCYGYHIPKHDYLNALTQQEMSLVDSGLPYAKYPESQEVFRYLA